MDDDELDDAFDEMGDASDDARPKKTTKPAPVTAFNFSFALGGWLMIYNFGVAKCLLDHGLHKVDPERQSIIGSSAGSLSAAALVLEADIDKVCVCRKLDQYAPYSYTKYSIFLVPVLLYRTYSFLKRVACGTTHCGHAACVCIFGILEITFDGCCCCMRVPGMLYTHVYSGIFTSWYSPVASHP